MTVEMQKLCNQRAALLQEGDALAKEGKYEELAVVNEKVKGIDDAISTLEIHEKSQKESVSAVATNNDKKKFATFGEQLKAVVKAAKSNGRDVDERLVKNELSGGLNTENDADGGYAIQSDFLGAILDRAFERSEILRRVRTLSITNASNSANWVTVDDSGDADKEGVVVAGGVQMYWTSEGVGVPYSKFKLKKDELKLAKAMGNCPVTEEMLEDVSFTGQLLEDSFADALAGLLTQGIINGLGKRNGYADQPYGIMGSNALVTVTASSSAITAQDFLNMKARMRKKNWSNAVWVMHPDLEADLPLLNDGNNNLVFLPEGGISGSQYATILGRPVIFDEFLAAKGTKGDILLADFDEYLLIKKGAERKDWSPHIFFLTDEHCFRIVQRVNGKPFNNTTYAVRNSSVTRSAFVTLSARGTRLTAPSVSIDSSTGVPSWSAVSNATGYVYKIKADGASEYGQEQETSSTSVSALTDGDTITVKAVGNGTTYVDSSWSDPKTYTEL